MIEKYLDEITTDSEVIEALKEADHFLITHYCKKRDQIETRRSVSYTHLTLPTNREV